ASCGGRIVDAASSSCRKHEETNPMMHRTPAAMKPAWNASTVSSGVSALFGALDANDVSRSMSTVAMTATPTPAGIWRWAWESAEARPVSLPWMLAKAAVWIGMKMNPMNTPRVNMSARMVHWLVSSPMVTNMNETIVTPRVPTMARRLGPIRGY